MVSGDRLSTTYFAENKRLFHNFGNRLVRALVNRLFCGRVNDVMTGYRAFSRQFVNNFKIISRGFEIETEMTIFSLLSGMRTKEIPVLYKDRPLGSVSKLHTIKDGVKVLKMVLYMYILNRKATYVSLESFGRYTYNELLPVIKYVKSYFL